MATLSLQHEVSTPTHRGTPRHPGPRACPLCDHDHSHALRSLAPANQPGARRFTLRRCAACGVCFIDPLPGDEELVTLYGEEFYFNSGPAQHAIGAWVVEAIQRQRRARVERLTERGRLLDIGSGDGSFVHHMAAHGWDALGIDLSPAAKALAERAGGRGRFLTGTLADQDFVAEGFDAITLWQVLEHIGEPRAMLAHCRELLAPGGAFVASVPNLDGAGAHLTGDRWWGLDVPRHLVHYTPATLRRALEGAGFRVVDIRHLSLQYDPYALFHSTLDWVFTRRHFLSDLAKGHLPATMPDDEVAYNVAALALLGPVLAPACVVGAAVGACCAHGGFIEIHAYRD